MAEASRTERGGAPGRGTFVLVLALAALLLAPTLGYRMGLDQGVFAYIGAELLEGNWPYLDTWDHAFPGLMYLNALEIAVFGRSIPAFRFADYLWQIVTALLIFAITRRIAGTPAAIVAVTIYCLSYQSYGTWNTAQREGFSNLFALGGYGLYLRFGGRRPVAVALAIGLGIGLAVTIKPTLLAFAALYTPLLLKLGRDAVKPIVAAAVGLVLPSAFFVGLYAALGGLQELWEATIAYQTEVYLDHNRGDMSQLQYWWHKLSSLGTTSKALAVGYLPFLFFGEHRLKRFGIYLGFLGGLFAVWLQGTFAGYHYLASMALGAVLTGSAIMMTLGVVISDRPIKTPLQGRLGPVSLHGLAAIALLLVALPVYIKVSDVRNVLSLHFLEPPADGEYTNETVFDFTEDWQVAQHLRENTTRQDRIQVWGHESLVYYLAERRAASRFQTSNPLVMRPPGGSITPMQERFRLEFLEAIKRERPAYVVVVTKDNWWWAPEQKTSKQLLEEFPEWRDFIFDHYELERRIGRLEIYRCESRCDSTSASSSGVLTPTDSSQWVPGKVTTSPRPFNQARNGKKFRSPEPRPGVTLAA